MRSLAGVNLNGRFEAVACKNLTANWLSPLRSHKFIVYFLVFMGLSALLFFFMILPIFMSAACLYFAHKVKQRDALLKQAHEMVQQV